MGTAEVTRRFKSPSPSDSFTITTTIVIIATMTISTITSAQFSQGNLRLVCVSAEDSQGAAALPSAQSCSPGSRASSKVQAQAQALRDTTRRQEQTIVDLQRTVSELLEKLKRCEKDGGGAGGRIDGVETLDRKSPGTFDMGSRSSPYAEDNDGDDGDDGDGGGDDDGGDGGDGGDDDDDDDEGARTDNGLLENALGKNSDKSDAVRLVFGARTNYMYARVRSTLPELHAFTLCTWLKRTGPGLGTVLSYAVLGQPNELTVMLAGAHGVEVVINDKVMHLPVRLPDSAWHHLCITWSARDGAWSAFVDGTPTGSGDGLAPWRPLRPGGVIVLGQEQDIVGGHFDATQAFVGELTQLEMWAQPLPPQDISSLALCLPVEPPPRVLGWSRRNLELRGGRGILQAGLACPLEQ